MSSVAPPRSTEFALLNAAFAEPAERGVAAAFAPGRAPDAWPCRRGSYAGPW